MSKFLEGLGKLAEVLTDEDRLHSLADKGFKHARDEVLGKAGYHTTYTWRLLVAQEFSIRTVSCRSQINLVVYTSIVSTGRHDDPIEKAHDRVRAEINASHRFDSFAAERSDNFVKWYVQPT